MRKWTLDKLVAATGDAELLNIYNELETGKMPSTSYAHEFCRKANKMIDDGELCVGNGSYSYRHVYLPTLSKAVYKEMAARYAVYLNNYKAPAQFESTIDGAADDEVVHCAWCNGKYADGNLVPTDLGMLCEQCISAIRSRGEDIQVLI